MKSKKQFFVESLIEWGKVNFREFPWRQTKNPFLILLAELLLSKTPAWRVKPVFETLAILYPEPKKMAKLEVQELATILEPLGLQNKRAKQLITVAKSLEELNAGKVPEDPLLLRELPGVGPYASNAVACFAFEKPVPLVDSNIGRVISRFFSFHFPGKAVSSKELWDFNKTLLPSEGAKAQAFYYALLDLSAELCKREPECQKCQLRRHCSYFKRRELVDREVGW